MSHPHKKVLETRVLQDVSVEALNKKLRMLQEANTNAMGQVWEPHGELVIFQQTVEPHQNQFVPTYNLVVNRYSITTY